MKISERGRFYILLLLALGAALVPALALFDRTLPFAEGWYTYYAKCIHEGALPYRDFEYLYPPVYIYTVALITRVFGYDILVLRGFGVLFFLLITGGLYLVACEVVSKRRAAAAAVAAVCGAFYLQSEVVQIFYDYVRFMDIFATFACLFLLKAAKKLAKDGACRAELTLCGLLLGVLVNVKQNTGLVLAAFALAAIIYLGVWKKRAPKQVVFDVACLLLPFLGVCLAVLGALAATGSLSGYFAMTGAGAAGAKGGLFAIFFGWLFHNGGAFLAALPAALVLDALLLSSLWWHQKRGAPPTHRAPSIFTATLFFAPLLGLLLTAILSPTVGRALAPSYDLSTYTIFLTVAPLFAALGVLGIVDRIKGRQDLAPFLPFFLLSGAYVALSFACGNSGGLAEGQASLGVVFLVLALFSCAERVIAALPCTAQAPIPAYAIRGGILALALALALRSADKKLLFPYNWWGMSTESYWENTDTVDLPYLGGLRLAPETAAVYEDIVATVTAHTREGEPILCFPQIPLFYVLTNRPDPGLFAKVQWFDVASDAAVTADMERVRENPPRAILIYHTSEYAYNAHEQAFRGGGVSGTRQMRDLLVGFVAEGGYRLHATYQAGGNALSLYLAP